MGRLFAWSVAVGSLSMIGALAADAQEMRTLVRPRAARVVQEAVLSKLETQNVIPVWVYFTDKGVHDDTALARALGSPEQFMSARALERQRKRGKPLGIRDLPVVQGYVDGVAATGVEIRHRLRWFNAVTVNATPGQIIRISNLPFVSSIDVIRGYPTHPPTPEELGLQGAGRGIPEVPRQSDAFYGFTPTQYILSQVVLAHEEGYTGAGVRIAMFDTGFDRDHPALRELPLIAERDFVQDDANTADEPGHSPPDEENPFSRTSSWCHGTSTWSMAGGYLPGQHVGVAFGAEFAIAKTEYIDFEQHEEEDNWAAAAEWAHNDVGADIISSSLGYRYEFDDAPGEYAWEQLDGKTTIVAQAANIAGDNGILVINSAGNDAWRPGGPFQTINSPSDSDSVLAVGAVYPENEWVTDFSSRGPAAPACPGCDQRIKPDVLAQGTLVHGATASGEFGCYDYNNPNRPGPYNNDGDPDYDQIDMSGTSFSCPLVAGMAALLLEAHNWEPHEARLALKETAADRAQGIEPSSERGYGVVRIMNAINFSGMGTALPPLRPGPFALVSPERFNGTNALTDPLQTYSWEEAGPSRFQLPRDYTLEIATDIHFENIIHAETTDALSLTPSASLPAEGYYYWRVVASDGSQFTRQSSQRHRILYDHPPQPFALLSPSNAGQPPELLPTFRWEESIDQSPDDTVHYTFYISRNPNAAGGRVFTDITDTTFTLPPEAPVSELLTHYWRVEATDQLGAVFRTPTFSFLAGAFPPTPFALLGPAARDSVATTRPTLTWRTSVDPNPDDSVHYDVYWGLDPDDLDGPYPASEDTSLRVGFGLLEDDRTYHWMVRAIDTFGNPTPSTSNSGPDSTGTFHVWLAPQPFALSAPPDEATVYGTPTFRWAVPEDETPDDSHLYTLTVYSDSTLATPLLGETGIATPSITLELGLTEDTTVWWRVQATDREGRSVWSTDTHELDWSSAPPAFAVRSSPNPLNPSQQLFTIEYDVPADMGGRPLAISVFDGQGRRVRNLASGTAQVGGDQVVTWDARSDGGSPVAAGMYFALVDVGGARNITKVIVLGQ